MPLGCCPRVVYERICIGRETCNTADDISFKPSRKNGGDQYKDVKELSRRTS